jgi:hypothetical protein
MHTVNEVHMLSTKMDALMRKIDESATFEKDQEAIQHYSSVHAIKVDLWCNVCGGDDHSGNNCPETREDVNFSTRTTGIDPNNNKEDGIHSPSIKVIMEVMVLIMAISIMAIIIITNLH